MTGDSERREEEREERVKETSTTNREHNDKEKKVAVKETERGVHGSEYPHTPASKVNESTVIKCEVSALFLRTAGERERECEMVGSRKVAAVKRE